VSSVVFGHDKTTFRWCCEKIKKKKKEKKDKKNEKKLRK
jgi:hypothetical protein